MNERHSFACSIPIGPVHPALKEPIRVVIDVEGERVVNVDIKRGFAHRGIEFMGMKRNAIQVIPLAERICGICSISHPYAFVKAVENAADIYPAERGQYIRTIIAELERIHSHILWLGVAAHEMGFDSLLYLTWKGREKVLDILEYLTGNRINYSMQMFGGARRDLDEKKIRALRDMISYYRIFNAKQKEIFLKDPTYRLRTRGVGILTKEIALQRCAVGPTARAAGIRLDVRQDQPFDAYADFGVKAIVPEDYEDEYYGDVYDVTLVRLYEIDQSLDIIEFCIDNLPNGPILSIPKMIQILMHIKKNGKEAVGRYEAPRGEVFHYVKFENSDVPKVWKVRAPSYSNINVWEDILLGAEIADVPVAIAYIDPCLCCNDRIAVVRKEGKVLPWEKIVEECVRKTNRIRREIG